MRYYRKLKGFSCLIITLFICNILRPNIALADNEPWYSGGQPVGTTPVTVAAQTEDPQLAQSASKNNCPEIGDPVNPFNGEFYYQCQDLYIPGREMDVAINHKYRSGKNFNGPFGFGWTMSYYYRLRPLGNGNVAIHSGDGRQDEHQLQGNQYIPPPGFYQSLVQETNGTWTLTEADGSKKTFDANGNISAIIDRNGNQITFSYDPAGLLPIIGVPLFAQFSGQVIVGFDYRLTTITDTVGRTVNFSYNNNGRLDHITDYSGRTVSFGYDPNTGDLLTITRPASPQYPQGLTKTFTYTSHRLETITDPKNQTFVTNHYDANGRVEQQDLGAGSFVLDYSVQGQTTVTDRSGNVVSYTFDTNGNVTRKEEFTRNLRPTDPASFVTTYTYNNELELASVTYPRGNGIKYTYAENNPDVRSRGNLLEVRRKTDMTQPDNNTNDIVTTLTHEQQANQVKTITDGRGNTVTFLFDYEFPVGHPLHGTAANLVGIQLPAVTGGVPVHYFMPNQYGQTVMYVDPNGIQTQLDYYSATGYLQRVIRDVGGINAVTQLTYDQWGDPDIVTDAENHATDLNFNELGWLVQETNPLGFVTKYTYDKNGNVQKIERQANPPSTQWQTVQFTYTSLNKLQTITDSLNRVTTIGYDNNENLASVLDAQNHTTRYDFDERDLLFKVRDANAPQGITQYDYDLNGLLAKITDANNHATDYTNDLFDRQQRITYADTRFSQFAYDKNSNITNQQTPSLANLGYGYDALNRLTSKTYSINPGVNTSYQYDLGSRLQLANNSQKMLGFVYDNLNRVQTAAQTYGPSAALAMSSYTYDKVDNRRTVTYPSGKLVEYTYDAHNRLDLVKVNNILIDDYNWDLLDRLSYIKNQMSPPAGAVRAYTFDIADQLTQITNKVGGAPGQFAYPAYDKVGNRLAMTLARGTTTQTAKYSYNNIYELSKVGGSQTHSFGYDKVNNRTNVDGVAYVPNNLNQYTSIGGQAYLYDNNGNLTNDGVRTYTYDEENRLQSVVSSGSSASYTYDGLNRRATKTVNGVTTYYLYDGDREIEERDATGALAADYVYGDGLDEVLTMTRGGQTYHYFYDGLGSVSDIANSAGTVVESYDYDVYGQPTTTSAIGNPFYFTGRRLDAETGLYYYRARMYSPTIGRFLQRDPIGYYDSMNLFSYVNNNPVNYTDPTGKSLFSTGTGDPFTDPDHIGGGGGGGGKMCSLGKGQIRPRISIDNRQTPGGTSFSELRESTQVPSQPGYISPPGSKPPQSGWEAFLKFLELITNIFPGAFK